MIKSPKAGDAGRLSRHQRRFLARVRTVSLAPWSGKISALDEGGAQIRIGKATFEKLRKAGLLIRSGSSLLTNEYVVSDTGRMAIDDPDFAIILPEEGKETL